MDKIKTRFSIADLSNLSDIPADTIRKWERRYGLLHPGRSGSNIRYYDLSDLCRLLSAAGLVRHGRRISEVAKMDEAVLESEVTRAAGAGSEVRRFMDAFLPAMLGFDRPLFDRAYRDLLGAMPFREAFPRVLFPFLHDIGTRWQSRSITPAHEHFISGLVCQKLHAEAGRYAGTAAQGPPYVLFLPLNELHEIGLLFLYCMLLRAGKNVIYLGAGMDLGDLMSVKNVQDGPVTYVTWLTVSPHRWKAGTYIDRVKKQLLRRGDALLVTGPMMAGVVPPRTPQVKCFAGGRDLLDFLLPAGEPSAESR